MSTRQPLDEAAPGEHWPEAAQELFSVENILGRGVLKTPRPGRLGWKPWSLHWLTRTVSTQPRAGLDSAAELPVTSRHSDAPTRDEISGTSDWSRTAWLMHCGDEIEQVEFHLLRRCSGWCWQESVKALGETVSDTAVEERSASECPGDL
jgi:hypothetical protein